MCERCDERIDRAVQNTARLAAEVKKIIGAESLADLTFVKVAEAMGMLVDVSSMYIACLHHDEHLENFVRALRSAVGLRRQIVSAETPASALAEKQFVVANGGRLQ